MEETRGLVDATRHVISRSSRTKNKNRVRSRPVLASQKSRITRPVPSRDPSDFPVSTLPYLSLSLSLRALAVARFRVLTRVGFAKQQHDCQNPILRILVLQQFLSDS